MPCTARGPARRRVLATRNAGLWRASNSSLRARAPALCSLHRSNIRVTRLHAPDMSKRAGSARTVAECLRLRLRLLAVQLCAFPHALPGSSSSRRRGAVAVHARPEACVCTTWRCILRTRPLPLPPPAPAGFLGTPLAMDTAGLSVRPQFIRICGWPKWRGTCARAGDNGKAPSASADSRLHMLVP